MRRPHVDDYVRLRQDIPELSLRSGQVGVVRSTWFAPSVAYEVEFHRPPGADATLGAAGPDGGAGKTRALLLAEQVEVEEGSLLGHAMEHHRDFAHSQG